MMVTAGGGSQRGISGRFFLVHISPACQEESNDVAVPLERRVIENWTVGAWESVSIYVTSLFYPRLKLRVVSFSCDAF